MNHDALILACKCHQPFGVNVFSNQADLIERLTDARDAEYAESALACAEHIVLPDEFDLGNGYFASRVALDEAIAKAGQLGGYCAPFAYADSGGVIHVGDWSNHYKFGTVDEAMDYARQARLSGDALVRAEAAFNDNLQNNEMAEYRWHVDAGLQLDALRSL